MPDSSHATAPDDLAGEDLEVVPAEWDPREVYFLMTGLVVPRPIAWVATMSADGTPNIAPHSYFNVMSNDPPHVVFGSSGRKDTLENIDATGEFTISITTEHVLEEMNATAVDAPSGVDELDLVGIATTPSATVAPPRVASAKGHLECRVVQTVPAGNATIVVGEVVRIHVDAGVWRNGRIDPQLLRPLLRFAGTTYATVGEVFKLPRPVWAQDVASLPHGDRSWIPRRDGSLGGSGTASP